jgi:hypothetical protein
LLVQLKENGQFQNVSGAVLMEFLKQNSTKAGRVTKHIELMQFVPFVKEKDTSDNSNCFKWVYSNFAVDRCLERVDPAGWELKNYMENPVVLWAHNNQIPAIGYSLNIDKGAELSGTVQFNEKEFDEFGWSIGQRVKFGSIRSGSVGFLVKEIEFIDHTKTPDEKADVIFRNQELLEFSICNVPANPYALKKDAVQIPKKKEVKSFNFFDNFLGGIDGE